MSTHTHIIPGGTTVQTEGLGLQMRNIRDGIQTPLWSVATGAPVPLDNFTPRSVPTTTAPIPGVINVNYQGSTFAFVPVSNFANVPTNVTINGYVSYSGAIGGPRPTLTLVTTQTIQAFNFAQSSGLVPGVSIAVGQGVTITNPAAPLASAAAPSAPRPASGGGAPLANPANPSAPRPASGSAPLANAAVRPSSRPNFRPSYPTPLLNSRPTVSGSGEIGEAVGNNLLLMIQGSAYDQLVSDAGFRNPREAHAAAIDAGFQGYPGYGFDVVPQEVLMGFLQERAAQNQSLPLDSLPIGGGNDPIAPGLGWGAGFLGAGGGIPAGVAGNLPPVNPGIGGVPGAAVPGLWGNGANLIPPPDSGTPLVPNP